MKFSGKLRLYNYFLFSFTVLYFTKVKLVVPREELKGTETVVSFLGHPLAE